MLQTRFGASKMLLSSDIMDLSLLEQALDLFKPLCPSRKRKPMSETRGKESKQETTSPLKDIVGKDNTTTYWLLLSYTENIHASVLCLIFPNISSCGLDFSSPLPGTCYYTGLWTVKVTVEQRVSASARN